jgi:hypothetical protein
MQQRVPPLPLCAAPFAVSHDTTELIDAAVAEAAFNTRFQYF